MRFDYGIRKVAAVFGMVFVLCFGICEAPAFAAGEPEVYASYESFSWREFGDAGERLLRESGPLYAVGFAYAHEFPNHMTLKPRIELFGGEVDYDGATTGGGPSLPVTSNTGYFGFKFEMDAGGKIWMGQKFNIEPFAGFGARSWARDIQDSITTDGTFIYLVNGYTENWATMYGRLGVRSEMNFAKESRAFAEVGVKLPIYSENYIDDTSVSYEAITLEPKNKASFFAEAGIKLNVFKLTAFYDTMRFKKSDAEFVFDPFYGSFYIWQPRSEADIYGIRIGAAF